VIGAFAAAMFLANLPLSLSAPANVSAVCRQRPRKPCTQARAGAHTGLSRDAASVGAAADGCAQASGTRSAVQRLRERSRAGYV
jgi:hypothetical protein